jgi:tetratricopeptide (TPR) repeat protein
MGTQWSEAIYITKLDINSAREVFLLIAGERFRSAPNLDDILRAVDCVPLAVALLAHTAEPEPDLGELEKRWGVEGNEILVRIGKPDRYSDIGFSCELSIASSRMTGAARRLLALLGVLPDGLAREDLNALLPKTGASAAATLRRVGLAFDDGPRLRVLAPVREHVHRHHAPLSGDLAYAVAHFVSRAAAFGHRIGYEGGAEAVSVLISDSANIEAMILAGLDHADPSSSIRAACALVPISRLFLGLGTTTVLRRASEKAWSSGLLRDRAECELGIGRIALRRSDHVDARRRFELAEDLFRDEKDNLGVARCLRALGDLELAQLSYDAARVRFEQALTLFHRIGDVEGEANCIQGLGRMALRCSMYQLAYDMFSKSLPMFRSVANRQDEAYCIYGLARVSLVRQKYDEARARFKEALALNLRNGNVQGYADCLRGFGDVALAMERRGAASALFKKSLSEYTRIGEPYNIGLAHRQLARAVLELHERQQHIIEAARAWSSIRRADLVTSLQLEFMDLERGISPKAE